MLALPEEKSGKMAKNGPVINSIKVESMKVLFSVLAPNVCTPKFTPTGKGLLLNDMQEKS